LIDSLSRNVHQWSCLCSWMRSWWSPHTWLPVWPLNWYTLSISSSAIWLRVNSIIPLIDSLSRDIDWSFPW
jgi:hypothetical protein